MTNLPIVSRILVLLEKERTTNIVRKTITKKDNIMANIRKLVTVNGEDYPSASVAAKVKRTILGSAPAKFLTRKDLAQLLKSNAFDKAPNTFEFLADLKDEAKENGAYYIKLSA